MKPGAAGLTLPLGNQMAEPVSLWKKGTSAEKMEPKRILGRQALHGEEGCRS